MDHEISRIADALGVSIRWLLDGSADEPSETKLRETVTSLSRDQLLAAYDNLHEPGRQMLTRLAVSAGLVPGFDVEVTEWTEPQEATTTKPPTEQMPPGSIINRIGRTGRVTTPAKRTKKPGAA